MDRPKFGIDIRRLLAACAVLAGMVLFATTLAAQPTEDGEAPASLSETFGYSAEQLDDADALRSRVTEIREQLAEREASKNVPERERLRAETRRDTLLEQLDGELPRAARRSIVRSLADAHRRLAVEQAATAATEAHTDTMRRELNLLEARLDTLAERRTLDEEWLEQARQSEQAALDALQDARELELAEADETRKRLLKKQRKLAEDVLEATREHHQTLTELRRDTAEQLQELSRRKGELLEQLEGLSDEVSQEQRGQADEVFASLMALRREVHSQFRDVLREAEAAEQPVEDAQRAVEEASTALNEERRRQDRLGASDIWELRVEVARMRLERAEQRLKQARGRLDAHRERVRDYLPHLRFFPRQLPLLLPRISGEARGQFFDVTDAERWDFALLAMRNGAEAMVLSAREQWNRALSADLFEMDAWVWLWGVVWRLAVVVIGIRLLLPLLPTLIGRMTDALMRFQFIRRHPTATIKLAELGRALLAPLVYYVGMRFVAAYLTENIPQVEALVWLIDAFFIYWFAVATSRVIVVSRWQRREQGHVSAEPFENIDEADASALADLFVLEPERASKLMRSVRVVVVFWLLTVYVPDVIRWIGGVTVLWWVVEQVAVWGFIGLVYWVLSQWKDDIASGFEQLASDRMSGVVDFVNRHKDRPWGVLVIALASVYVLLKEIVILFRRYLLSSEWVRRAQSFAFRKQIELRDGEDAAGHKTGPDALPSEYVDRFRASPPAEASLYVDRIEYTRRALEQFERWQDNPKSRGSLIITGEPGVGVTTFVTGLEDELDAETDMSVRSTRLSNDVRSTDDVLSVVAELFDLEAVPDTKAELIEQLDAVEPRVVIMDDCHNTFTRQIEGFEALETLLDITNLCDEQHFFVLTFNLFAWNYVNRIYSREHYFGTSMELKPWSESELRQLIEARNNASGYSVSFANLMPDDSHAVDDRHFEVIKTANGYYRYLHEFSGGKPAVALEFWLRSLSATNTPNELHVSLFRRPSMRELKSCSYDHWFLLSALVQHTDLNAREASEIVNLSPGFCTLALDYFDEERVIEFDDETGRARLTPVYLQQVIDHLTNSNFLYR